MALRGVVQTSIACRCGLRGARPDALAASAWPHHPTSQSMRQIMKRLRSSPCDWKWRLHPEGEGGQPWFEPDSDYREPEQP
jgi:hypothetical protein